MRRSVQAQSAQGECRYGTLESVSFYLLGSLAYSLIERDRQITE